MLEDNEWAWARDDSDATRLQLSRQAQIWHGPDLAWLHAEQKSSNLAQLRSGMAPRAEVRAKVVHQHDTLFQIVLQVCRLEGILFTIQLLSLLSNRDRKRERERERERERHKHTRLKP